MNKKFIAILSAVVILVAIFLPFNSNKVYADADVALESTALTTHYIISSARSGIFWKSSTVGYFIFINNNTDITYRKTTNGGSSWGSQVNILTANVRKMDCWADWQNPGDSGTKIHITYLDFSTTDIRYIYLDTATDTAGGDALIEDCQGSGTFGAGYGNQNVQLSITKSIGGNLAVSIKSVDNTSTQFYSFYTSSNGSTWTSNTSPWEAAVDYLLLFPGNEADSQDLWGVFWDVSANEISLKTYDNSENSWSETSIGTSMSESNAYLQMDGSIRQSDSHLLLSAWNIYDNATADFRTWDINGAGSITEKATIVTDSTESFLSSLFIDQSNNDVYVSYARGTAIEDQVSIFYKKSTDGMANWSIETAMQMDAEDDTRWIGSGVMKASLGGRFLPVWFDDDDDDLFCNYGNSISIAPVLDIDLDLHTWSAGTLTEGSNTNTALDYYTVTNNSAYIVDITVSGTDLVGSGKTWTLASDGSPGDSIYGLYTGLEGGSFNIVVKKTSPNYLKEDLVVSGAQSFGLKIYAPTDNIGTVAMSGTVTLTASLSI